MTEEFEGKGVDERGFPSWAHGILFVAFVLTLGFLEAVEYIRIREEK